MKSTIWSSEFLAVALVLGVSSVAAQDSLAAVDPPESEQTASNGAEEGADTEGEETFKVFEWGSKGLDLRSRDGNYHAHIEWRAQIPPLVRFALSVGMTNWRTSVGLKGQWDEEGVIPSGAEGGVEESVGWWEPRRQIYSLGREPLEYGIQ